MYILDYEKAMELNFIQNALRILILGKGNNYWKPNEATDFIL
jgi:hypothetical protein